MRETAEQLKSNLSESVRWAETVWLRMTLAQIKWRFERAMA